MGAWGAGSFENDTALDWILDCKSTDDIRAPLDQLVDERDKSGVEFPAYMDANIATRLIVAAECIGFWIGRGHPDFPEELKDILKSKLPSDDPIVSVARNAIVHIAQHSELAELWEEDDDGDDPNEWQREMSRLIDRLDLEIELNSIPGQIPNVDEADNEYICIFCNQPISTCDLHNLRIYKGMKDKHLTAIVTMHGSCFEAAIHPEFQDNAN